MINIIAVILCSICGALLICAYGKECISKRKSKLSFLIFAACFDLLLAGMNLSKFLDK